jgi:hypothetical protein
LEKRYSDLWINRDLALIDDAAARFASERHHAARSVRELYETHYLAEVPRDPKGGEYSISADGRAGTKLAYDKLELHSPGLRKLEVKVKAR